MTHAIGTFEVKLTPNDDDKDTALGRMSIDKQFYGETLTETSKSEMLTGMNERQRLRWLRRDRKGQRNPTR